MSSPVLEAARAERAQLEERCAWHRGQLDRLEQQLEALKEIERLAERLGHGTAGEAPPATAPGGGVSPARSVPKGAGARQRPAQRTAAGPSRAPALHTVESGRQRREVVLDAIRAGHEKPAEISEATGIAKGGLKDILRSLAAEGVIEGTGATRSRRYRLASAGPGPVVLTEAERAGQSQAAKQDKRDARQAVLAALKDGPLTTMELRERTGLDQHGQSHACGELARAGKIISQGDRHDGSQRWLLWEHARHGTPAAAKPGHEASGLIEDGGEDYAPAPNFDHEPKAAARGRVIA